MLPRIRSRRFLLWYVLPIVALQLFAVGSLVVGTESLYLRDVLHTHLTAEISMAGQAHGLAPPILDLGRSGGQPAAGNPNFLPYYPTSLLYRVVAPLWALNAHFWLHFLVLPWGFFALARVWGLEPEPAWVGATFYAFSGFTLSQMSYYNLVPAVTLTPLLVATGLRAVRSPSRGWVLGTGLLWTLLLVSGDPTLAVWALVALLAACAVDASGGASRLSGLGITGLGIALAGGTLLATPQWVELARILPTSFRWQQGYDGSGAGVFRPLQAIDWWIPAFFGRTDRIGPEGFWGAHYYGGALPFFLTLSPGLLVLVLAAASRFRGRSGVWAGLCVVLGLIVSLGLLTPLLRWASGGALGGLLRFPVKAWILVALGGSLWAAGGFASLRSEQVSGTDRRLWGAWFAALSLAILAALHSYRTMERGSTALWEGIPPEAVGPQAARWFQVASAVVGLILLAGLALALVRRQEHLGGALLVVLFAGSQVALLGFTLARVPAVDVLAEEVEVPTGLRSGVVHAGVSRLPGWWVPGSLGVTGDAGKLVGRAAEDLYPFVGVRHGIAYELAPSPEGLDSYLTYLALDATRRVSGERRVHLLGIWGVEAVFARPGLEVPGLVWAEEEPTHPRRALYRVLEPVQHVRLVTGVRYQAEPRAVLEELLSASFDPHGSVVVLGEGEDRSPGAGRVVSLELQGDTVVAEVAAEKPSHLVVQRTFQPVYRATVDGARVELVVADLHRLAVPLSAGRHRVEIEVDRRISRLAWIGPLLGGLLLLVAAIGLGPRRRESAAML